MGSRLRTQRGAPIAWPGFLAEGEHPDQQLQQHLRLRVAAHGAEHGVELAVRAG